MPLILENISKVVKSETHIQPLNLELAPGSFNTLLGRTGSGKTTLLRLMAGLDRPSGGRISMHGRDVTGLSVRRRNVAMVYQQFVNYPNFTVFRNLASPLKVAGVDRAEIDRRVREVAETMHLEDCLDRLPAELSGGQQQRTALARALVKDADLLLLDEPLVNLDYKLREELRFELRNIFDNPEAIIVYAATYSTTPRPSSSTPRPSPGRLSPLAGTPSWSTRGGCCNKGPRPRSTITRQTCARPIF